MTHNSWLIAYESLWLWRNDILHTKVFQKKKSFEKTGFELFQEKSQNDSFQCHGCESKFEGPNAAENFVSHIYKYHVEQVHDNDEDDDDANQNQIELNRLRESFKILPTCNAEDSRNDFELNRPRESFGIVPTCDGEDYANESESDCPRESFRIVPTCESQEKTCSKVQIEKWSAKNSILSRVYEELMDYYGQVECCYCDEIFHSKNTK